jgi:site-specific DNA-cytosine methylase
VTFGSLFAGIGGIDLGLERAGLTCRWQVENDKECIRNLEKHWPGVKRYGDITGVSGNDLEPVDLIAGGFPCQDLSQAGKRIGIEGSRSGLWFEFARLVGELRPRYVLVENVPGLLVYDGMRRVIGELARLGYVGIWLSVRASDVGASHLRKRVFIVAYCKCERRERRRDAAILGEPKTVKSGEGLQRQRAGHATDNRGDDLAHSASARYTSLWENPGGSDSRTGEVWSGRIEPERIGGALGHSERSRRTAPRIRRDLDAGSESTGCGGMANPSTGFLPQPRRRPERGDGTGSAGEILLEDSDARRSACRRERSSYQKTGRTGEPDQPERSSLDLAVSGYGQQEEPQGANGLSEQRQAQRRRPEQSSGTGAGSGVGVRADAGRTDRNSIAASNPPAYGLAFAPGPSDPRWPSILRERPDLAPALESPLCRMADGLPDWMDGAMKDRTRRLRRLGNAVVPQVAEYIGRRIMEFSSWQT